MASKTFSHARRNDASNTLRQKRSALHHSKENVKLSYPSKRASDFSDVSDSSDYESVLRRSSTGSSSVSLSPSSPGDFDVVQDTLTPELISHYLNSQRGGAEVLLDAESLGSNGSDGDFVTQRRRRREAFILPLLDSAETSELAAVSGDLGVDPSSAHFANRTKSIAFVLSIGGRWFQINQDFFNQASEYNDFSGGYKRFYDELPRTFIESPVAQRLLTSFATVYGIPDGELILVQVQSSNITPADAGKCLTGQGIHSDGADRAMLICLERDNVTKARSSVYRDPMGESAIVDRHTLQEGEVLFWKDNEIYHYVEPAELEDGADHGTRTVMIAHYPAMHYITGKTNPNNDLPPSGFHPKYVRDAEEKQEE